MMYSQALALGLLLVISGHLSAENPYTAEESLQIREACIELGNRYAYYLDTGQIDRIPDLFDEQGSWQGRAGRYTGREDIKLAFSRRPKNRRTVHLVTNHLVDIQSKNMVEVISNFTTYRTDKPTGIAPLDGQPVRVGRYTDECVRYEKGWIFQSREMEEIFGVGQ
jgi:SnoaL-like domain